MNANTSTARTYIFTAGALLGMLVLTIAGAYLNLGLFNGILTATISVVSTAVIILFYMEVRKSKPLIWVFVGAGFFWLGILFVLTLSGFMTRGWK